MAITEGDSLPDVTVHTMQNGRPTPGSISDMVAGKKTVIFAVPGAFTPTCSEEHLPGFVEHAEAIKAKGVDDILCVAVNDPFVMDAWQQNRGADAITMVADGNGNLANALGLAMDGSGFGHGYAISAIRHDC